MKTIDKEYDEILKVKYTLIKTTIKELRAEVKKWYPNMIFEKFDTRNEYYDIEENKAKDPHTKLLKEAGSVCNYFFAYKEGKDYYLLDGFNRLLTKYGAMNENVVIYLKVITSPLKPHDVMRIMFTLNMWKLSGDNYSGFTVVGSFLDRGMRLLLYKMFGVYIYYNLDEYDKRKRHQSDFYYLEHYFHKDDEFCSMFKYAFLDVQRLFSQERIVDDFRQLIEVNDYVKLPFKNFDRFANGYAMFLSRRRLKGDRADHPFSFYLDILKHDKFFKKLQKMSWTDSTRKNVLYFFQKLEKEIDE